MKLIAQLKLNPTPEQAAALFHTLDVANAACNHISNVAWQQQVFGKFDLQKLCYATVRESFGLAAQMTIRCLAKVGDSYKLDRKTQRRYRSHGSIAYDDRILSFNLLAPSVSIWTTSGRQAIPFVAGVRQIRLLASHVVAWRTAPRTWLRDRAFGVFGKLQGAGDGFRRFHPRLDMQIRDKIGILRFEGIVQRVMQRHAIFDALLPAIGSNRVEHVRKLTPCFQQGGCLFGGRLQFDADRALHSTFVLPCIHCFCNNNRRNGHSPAGAPFGTSRRSPGLISMGMQRLQFDLIPQRSRRVRSPLNAKVDSEPQAQTALYSLCCTVYHAHQRDEALPRSHS